QTCALPISTIKYSIVAALPAKYNDNNKTIGNNITVLFQSNTWFKRCFIGLPKKRLINKSGKSIKDNKKHTTKDIKYIRENTLSLKNVINIIHTLKKTPTIIINALHDKTLSNFFIISS